MERGWSSLSLSFSLSPSVSVSLCLCLCLCLCLSLSLSLSRRRDRRALVDCVDSCVKSRSFPKIEASGKSRDSICASLKKGFATVAAGPALRGGATHRHDGRASPAFWKKYRNDLFRTKNLNVSFNVFTLEEPRRACCSSSRGGRSRPRAWARSRTSWRPASGRPFKTRAIRSKTLSSSRSFPHTSIQTVESSNNASLKACLAEQHTSLIVYEIPKERTRLRDTLEKPQRECSSFGASSPAKAAFVEGWVTRSVRFFLKKSHLEF